MKTENNNTCLRWCIRHSDGLWLKKASYGGFSLVDHPSRASLYTTRKQAENRINSCWPNECQHKLTPTLINFSFVIVTNDGKEKIQDLAK